MAFDPVLAQRQVEIYRRMEANMLLRTIKRLEKAFGGIRTSRLRPGYRLAIDDVQRMLREALRYADKSPRSGSGVTVSSRQNDIHSS